MSLNYERGKPEKYTELGFYVYIENNEPVNINAIVSLALILTGSTSILND